MDEKDLRTIIEQVLSRMNVGSTTAAETGACSKVLRQARQHRGMAASPISPRWTSVHSIWWSTPSMAKSTPSSR